MADAAASYAPNSRTQRVCACASAIAHMPRESTNRSRFHIYLLFTLSFFLSLTPSASSLISRVKLFRPPVFSLLSAPMASPLTGSASARRCRIYVLSIRRLHNSPVEQCCVRAGCANRGESCLETEAAGHPVEPSG